MSMVNTITLESGYLKIVVTGDFSLEEAKRTFIEVLDSVARHKIDKVLLDGRELIGEPGDLDRFYYGKFAAETVISLVAEGLGFMPRFAYVLTPPVLDENRRFGETVAVNRGMIVKTFRNPEDSFEWLKIVPTDS